MSFHTTTHSTVTGLELMALTSQRPLSATSAAGGMFMTPPNSERIGSVSTNSRYGRRTRSRRSIQTPLMVRLFQTTTWATPVSRIWEPGHPPSLCSCFFSLQDRHLRQRGIRFKSMINSGRAEMVHYLDTNAYRRIFRENLRIPVQKKVALSYVSLLELFDQFQRTME